VTYILPALIYLYCIALVIYVIWVRLRWPRPWWLHAAAPFALWFFGPILLLPILALGLRAIPAMATSLVAVMLYLWHFGFGRRRGGSAVPPYLTVMTANLLKRNTVRLDEIVDTILMEGPDIVALPEVKREHIRVIRRRLSHIYSHMELISGVDCQGMGVLSKYPFLSAENHLVTHGANPTQIIRVRIEGRSLAIVNVHPRIPYPLTRRFLGIAIPYDIVIVERRTDIEGILSLTDDLGGSMVVLGDFNLTDQDEAYAFFTERWRDVYREAKRGPALTYPLGAEFFGMHPPFPLFGIDHILCSHDLCPIRAHIGIMPGSDHCYMVATIGRADSPRK